ncbi:MAG: hypothetical protein ABSD52_10325 [Candidatus Cybelea sp.]
MGSARGGCEQRDRIPATRRSDDEDEARAPHRTVGAGRHGVARSSKALLAAGSATSEFVLTSDEGPLIRHSNLIRRWWKPLLKAAKIEATRAAGDDNYRFPTDRGLYSLRHTSDQVAALSGVGYDLISARLGHTTLGTTYAHYLNVSEDRERDVADKIGGFIEGLRKHG